MRWRVDPLSLALTVSAAAAEALAVAPWVAWLAVLSQAEPAAVPSWLTLAATGLVAFVLARTVLARTADLAWARLLAAGGWLLWTWSWWAVRHTGEPFWGYVPALFRLDSGAVGLALLSALAWWRALVLANEPFPFQGDYLRWAVLRDAAAVGGATLVAALSGGAAAQAAWDRLALAVPSLLLFRLLTAALVQAQAVRLAYPEAGTPVGWIVRSLVLAGAILAAGALASLAAGPALWPRIAQAVTWLFTLVVAVLVTFAVALALVVWWTVRLLAWVLRLLARPGAPGPPPSLPALPELLRPQDVLATLPIPGWLVQGLAVLAGGALLVLLARLVARSVRRLRRAPGAPAASEARERIPLDRSGFLPRWRRSRRLGPALRRGLARPRDVRSAYRAALALLAARGLTRRPSETPLALARRVAQSFPHLSPAFTDLTARYLLARYAERETPDDRAAALADWQELRQRASVRD
ncbi:DUF4129 domain-containing protein [Thermomicrobium sp. 4228-Ro]|uniref:DUF4129 domain-containing protein n=1 Tax=Thermomicrobium sp. 4228-Ro TaxID=2993937 RepID=UPI00224923B3|nr:DUF4129 domain-containing protein [Thermomicrobium sp. 4228-Ro]MCX2728114.1 DUF4129 domain-containing protein [Thermomicrobium sp. 4228-Ro]